MRAAACARARKRVPNAICNHGEKIGTSCAVVTISTSNEVPGPPLRAPRCRFSIVISDVGRCVWAARLVA